MSRRVSSLLGECAPSQLSVIAVMHHSTMSRHMRSLLTTKLAMNLHPSCIHSSAAAAMQESCWHGGDQALQTLIQLFGDRKAITFHANSSTDSSCLALQGQSYIVEELLIWRGLRGMHPCKRACLLAGN